MARLFAMSDLHVDYKANMQRMLALSNADYTDDTLIIAGDVSDKLATLERLLGEMLRKFDKVSFVPGNHELWLRTPERESGTSDSLAKFQHIRALCDRLGVASEPFALGSSDSAEQRVWVVPLYSWYRSEVQDEDSLYIEKDGEDWENSPWMDKMLCHWPQEMVAEQGAAAEHFLQLNAAALARDYDAPIISFSHFLPRRELIFDSLEIAEKYCGWNDGKPGVIPRFEQDPNPTFNFSRVAGCQKIDAQIRQLGSRLHVHGHQHRNRNREIDGVNYVSNCLGYARERALLGDEPMPLKLWEDGEFLQPADSFPGLAH